MENALTQPTVDFSKYPDPGCEDFEYAFATAQVRTLQTKLLTKPFLLDLINAQDYTTALDMLNSSDYSTGQSGTELKQIEKILIQIRTDVRKLFKDLIIDQNIVEPLLVREDYANLRLALRRKLTDKPLGVDYNNDGSVNAEDFEKIFETEDYSTLPYHMREAIEIAVLTYYQHKNVRDIDLALDRTYMNYKLTRAVETKNTFLTELFRMQIDMNNIKTMLRLKFTESEPMDVFLDGGYIYPNQLKFAVDDDYESIKKTFSSTPYGEIINQAANYLNSENSFLKLEQMCDEHIAGFLKTTDYITAGPQPIIAYLLLKEAEIRKIRLILTAKKNGLNKELILDRIGR